MTQIKYLTDNIDELNATEHDLESNGIPRSHIHIFSRDNAKLKQHNLPAYSEWSKRDIFHSGLRGAFLGAFLGIFIIVGSTAFGLADAVGWAVPMFAAVFIMGFCTWEGGLMGIGKINHEFKQHREAIENGQHLLVIDAHGDTEEYNTRYTVGSHPILRSVE